MLNRASGKCEVNGSSWKKNLNKIKYSVLFFIYWLAKYFTAELTKPYCKFFAYNMNPNSFYKSSLILFVISDMVWHVHMYTCLSIYGKPISLSNFKSWLSLSSNLDRRKYRFAKTHCVSLNWMICIIHVRLSLEILELCQHFFSLF